MVDRYMTLVEKKKIKKNMERVEIIDIIDPVDRVWSSYVDFGEIIH